LIIIAIPVHRPDQKSLVRIRTLVFKTASDPESRSSGWRASRYD